MSAANFYTINSGAIFAVTDNGAACHRVRTFGRSRGWDDIYNRGIWDGGRSYPGRSVLEKDFTVDLPGGRSYDLGAVIVRRAGYYSGAALDWDIKCDAGSLAEDFRGNLDELAVAIVDGIFDDLRYYYGWNEGLVAIFRPRVQKAVETALNGIQKQADALCAWGCDIKLRCVGVFSNGEAIYC